MFISNVELIGGLIHSFNKYFFHARHCAGLWVFSYKQDRQGLASEQTFSGQRQAASKQVTQGPDRELKSMDGIMAGG